MPKKAFLVSFCPMTRVIVDVPEGFDPDNVNFINPEDKKNYDAIIAAARQKIDANLTDYLIGDNIDTLEEDLECPYDPKDPSDNPAAGNPEEVIKKIVTKYGNNGFLSLDDLGDKINEIDWTFTFDDNDCETLSLSSICAYANGTIEFNWNAPGYKVTDTLDDIDRDRLDYVLEDLSILL